jgi:uncharacterized repeat protein (TIGR01451 family)
MLSFIKSFFMKKIFYLTLLLILAKNVSAQYIYKDDCYSSGHGESIFFTHENTDGTTSIFTWNYLQPQDGYQLSLVILDAQKNVIQKGVLDSFFTTSNNFPSELSIDKEGNLTILGMNPEVRAFKYDKLGKLLWISEALWVSWSNHTFGTIKQSDDGYIVEYLSNDVNGHLVSLSLNGEVQWINDLYFQTIMNESNSNNVWITPAILKNGNIYVEAVFSYYCCYFTSEYRRTVQYLYNSNGDYIAERVDSIYANDYPVYDYGSNRYIVKTASPDTFYTFIRNFFSSADLSLARSDTFHIPSNPYYNLGANTTYDDTTHFFVFPQYSGDSTLRCLDIYMNPVWSCRIDNDEPYNYMRGPLSFIIDNNTILYNNSLVENGIVKWRSSLYLADTLVYNGITYRSHNPTIGLDYNKTDIFCVLTFSKDYMNDVHLLQVIDRNTGQMKERMLFNGFAGSESYFYRFEPYKLLDVTTDNVACSRSTYDLYMAYMKVASNIIQGNAYVDLNSNNQKESSEPYFTNGYATTQSSADTQEIHLSGDGGFAFSTDTGTYVTTVRPYNDYFVHLPAQFISAHDTFTFLDTVNFALQPLPGNNDVSVDLINNWRTRLGNQNTYTIVLKNKGASHSSGILKLVPDPRLLSSHFNLPYDNISGDTLIWNIASLNIEQSLSLFMDFTGDVPPALNSGDTLKTTAWFINDTVDVAPGDNYEELREVVRASMDPNEKEIVSGTQLTQDEVAAGKYISYTIHFQNKGNDTAFRVVVIDTLSESVDVSSLQVIQASAPYTLEIIKERILKFTFRDIRLSDDTASTTSMGFISYKVRPKASSAPGVPINNTADIYFDYNQPVTTNTVSSVIYLLTSSNTHAAHDHSLSVYPNPNNGSFSITYKSNTTSLLKIELVDVTGNRFFEKQIPHSGQSTVEINKNILPKGFYLVKVSDGSAISTSAIIVQ